MPCFPALIQWLRIYELLDGLTLWVMNCLHSTATIIVKVDGRVKTTGSMDLQNCVVMNGQLHRLPSLNCFCWVTLPTTQSTLPKQSALFFKVNDSDLNIWFSILFLWAGDVLWEWDREHQAHKHVQKNQPGCENKLQHFANEHDTTLWRQHRFLTEWIRDTLLELFQRCEQNTNNWQAVLFNF